MSTCSFFFFSFKYKKKDSIYIYIYTYTYKRKVSLYNTQINSYQRIMNRNIQKHRKRRGRDEW